MVTKINKSSAQRASKSAAAAPAPALNIADAIRDSAQQIWQAGLGAFAKAQEGRSKVFDSLVQEGLSMQRKTQAVAEERINAATNKVSDMANDITAKATGQWDKLEGIFEDRVAKALARLGLPSSTDWAEMKAQLDALSRQAAGAGQATRKTVVSKAKTAAKAPKAAVTARAKPAAKAPASKALVKKASSAKKALASVTTTTDAAAE